MTKFARSQDLEHAAFPHLARVAWETLHRLTVVSGESVVTSLLRSVTPDQQRQAAQEFMERKFAEVNQRVSTPSRFSSNDAVKLEATTYSDDSDDHLPLDLWFREILIAIASRLIKAPSTKVNFLLSPMSKKAKQRALGKLDHLPNSEGAPEWSLGCIRATTRCVMSTRGVLLPSARHDGHARLRPKTRHLAS
ncbi:hypothetical protein PC121_g1190 [Phytophthora cactorum]|nr:hypothetical protein PC120_g4955 [Phytophthora cactorum]KAG3102644.1 hypothetical protein PC121_g1190 [Phytophthora cactorum]